jgi:hypothetical protein
MMRLAPGNPPSSPRSRTRQTPSALYGLRLVGTHRKICDGAVPAPAAVQREQQRSSERGLCVALLDFLASPDQVIEPSSAARRVTEMRKAVRTLPARAARLFPGRAVLLDQHYCWTNG